MTAASLPSLFADGIVEAHVTHGVARITLGQAGGDGTALPSGVLLVPLVQLPVVTKGLLALLQQIEAKMKQAQPPAATPSAAPGAAAAMPEAPAETPAAPEDAAFRFNA